MSATGVVSAAAHREATSGRWQGWVDRFVGSDPGLNRFRLALQTTVTIAAALGGEWLFVRTTNALLIDTHGVHLPAAQAAAVHAQHYGLLVTAMVIGSVIAVLTGLGVGDPDAGGQLTTVLCLPVPIIASLALGLAVNDHRVVSLVLLAASLGGGTYLRRFGARGFLVGATLFLGIFLGYSLRGVVTERGIGWLAAEIGVGIAVSLLVRFTLFYPRPARALQRTRRSFVAQVRKAASLALAVFDDREPADGPRNRRLARQLVRLNEAALMIDAQLALPGALDEGSSAHRLHQRIFDIELAVANIARLTSSMAALDLAPAQREAVRRALVAVRDADFAAAQIAGRDLAVAGRPEHAEGQDQPDAVLPHRFAGTVVALADAVTDWLAAGGRDPAHGDEAVFVPSVALAGGWLYGSAVVSAQASMQSGPGRADRIRLKPYTRVAIQMTVAVSVAIVAGDALSGRRFYWALIAVFATFMGTNNRGEQVTKGLLRVAGTVVGIAFGFGLAHAVGHHTNWTLVVVLAAMFFGFYLMRINYAFWVIGLVVSVSQVYVQAGEFTNTILLTRLAETALGAAIAILTVTFVLPIRTRHVIQVALRAQLAAMAALVGHATEQLLDHDAAPALRRDARALDSAHQTLIATAQPLRQNLFGELDERVSQTLGLAAAYRDYGRNLVTDVGVADLDLDPESRRMLERASHTLNTSIEQLIRGVDEAVGGVYVRSAGLFDRVERTLEARGGSIEDDLLALRDFQLIDQALAGLAAAMNLSVTSSDTAAIDATRIAR